MVMIMVVPVRDLFRRRWALAADPASHREIEQRDEEDPEQRRRRACRPRRPCRRRCGSPRRRRARSRSGTMPSTNASDVMMIGRRRSFTAAIVASIVLLPCASSSIANSTMRIAFFAASPMIVTRPTLKYTSADSPRSIVNRMEPSTPSGTTSSTDERHRPALVQRGEQEEHDHERHAHAATTICPDDCFSSNERPVQSKPKPSGKSPREPLHLRPSPRRSSGRARPSPRCSSTDSRCSAGSAAARPSTPPS